MLKEFLSQVKQPPFKKTTFIKKITDYKTSALKTFKQVKALVHEKEWILYSAAKIMNVFIYKGSLISRKKKNNNVISLTKITVTSLS